MPLLQPLRAGQALETAKVWQPWLLLRRLHLKYLLPTVEKVDNLAHLKLPGWPETVPWEKVTSLDFVLRENESVSLHSPETVLDDWRQNTVLAVCMSRSNNVGLAWADMVEGKTYFASSIRDQLPSDLARLRPTKIVYEGQAGDLSGIRAAFPRNFAGLDNVELGIKLASNDMSPLALAATAGLFGFLKDTSRQKFQVPEPAPVDRLELDSRAVTALELLTTTNSLKGSLFSEIKRTKTPSGTRRLEKMLLSPLLNQEPIERQLDRVEEMYSDPHQLLALQSALVGFPDGKKLLRRLFQGVSPPDLYQWAKSVEALAGLLEHLRPRDEQVLQQILLQVKPLADQILENMNEAWLEMEASEAPSLEYEPVFKPTFEPLAALYAKRTEFELVCAEVLGEFSMYKAKIRYNPKYGYHVHINGQPKNGEVAERVGKTSILKHPRLDEAGHAQAGFEARLKEQEQILLKQLRDRALTLNAHMRQAFDLIDEIDLTQSFATLALERRLTRPKFGPSLEIKDGRHLGVEQWSMENGKQFIANSCSLNGALMLTGPNMGGKSTFIRQVAHTIVLAQMGCFVPASSAQLPVFDKILCRMGSGDDSYMGQSTFMVEMLETSAILRRATPNSIALLDEVGRGTSRRDGVAIAFASIAELKCRALFATHFGPSIASLCRQEQVDIETLQCADHRVSPGICSDSLGIQLAQTAGFPEAAVKDAERYLEDAI